MAMASLSVDLVGEILRRLPSAAVARSSAVCRAWRGLLRSDAFRRRYHEFHRTPPVLGFFHNQQPLHLLVFAPPPAPDPDNLALFVPTAAMLRVRDGLSPWPLDRITSGEPQPMPHNWYAMDSRHGRVLFLTARAGADSSMQSDDWDFVVWDPAGGGWERILPPWKGRMDGLHWDVTVLCAVDGCDHLDCHDGHFIVVMVTEFPHGMVLAGFYSSRTRVWDEAERASLQVIPPDACRPNPEMKPTVLLGGMLYFLCFSSKILKYGMAGRQLALIDTPVAFDGGAVLMATEDGVLGFAVMQGFGITISSREEDADGVGQWTPRRLIEFDDMLPIGALAAPAPELIGLAEGVDVLFIRTRLGIFTVELNTGETKKVSADRSITNAIPYTSFHIPDNGTILHFAM